MPLSGYSARYRFFGQALVVFAALASAVVSFGGASADDQSDNQDTKEIEAAFVEFNASFRHLDWNRLRKTFATDATMFSPSQRTPKRLDGIAEIETVMKPMFEGNKQRRAASGGKTPEAMPRSLIDLKIQRFGETAVVTFQPVSAFGPERRSLTRRTLVLQKNGGKWLIVHLHASNTELSEGQ